MRVLAIVTAAAVPLAVVAYWIFSRPSDVPQVRIVYAASTRDGSAMSEKDWPRAAEAIAERLVDSGFLNHKIDWMHAPGRVVIGLPASPAPDLTKLERAIERSATLQFRVRAPAAVEQDRRGRVAEPLPPELAWLPLAERGVDVLVELPERPAWTELDALRQDGLNEESAAFRAAATRYDEAVRKDVFTGEQLAKCGIQAAGGRTYVTFEFTADRKVPFAAFTERNVGRELAIVIDGKVRSVPVIKIPLPGEGVIDGGESGFTADEADQLAAALGSGAMPVRLTRVEVKVDK